MKKKKSAPAENVGPTPETARKLKLDPLLALFYSGRINGTHLHCADEIMTAFTLLTLPVSLRMSNPGREGTSDPAGQMDRWAETLEKRGKLFERYTAWRKEVRRRKIHFGVVESIVINRQSCRAASRRFRIRDGIAGGLVREALDLYAVHAGYLAGAK